MSKLPLSLPTISLVLVLLLLIPIPFKVNSQSLGTEQSILLNLKQQLGNPPSISSWNFSSSPCDWPEIICANNTVTGIILKDKNVTGKIPALICDLKNLTVIDLSFNYIPGGFPKSLYNCSELKYLDLSQNYFVGPVPDDIEKVQTLQYLDLGANNFSGDIPAAIGKLPELRTLNIYQNQFNGTFPAEIGNLSNLEVLRMAYNIKLLPAEIPFEFGKLKKLRFLWMAKSNLIGEIPESFENLSSLVYLDLSRNNLVGRIPTGLFSLQNLSNLYLFRNELSGEIPRSIGASNLVEVDLSMNILIGSIPEDFGKLQKLELLSLYTNRLSGKIPASLGLLPSLRGFHIFSNNLTGTLPLEFGLHSKLEAFEVADNQLSGRLPENLCEKGVLQGVVAFSNHLSGELPKGLGNCRTLRTVQGYDNNFSGEVPSGLWTTFNLSSLMLSGNKFSGKLPNNLAWNLSRLEISNNRFSGQIPGTVSSWKSLVVFKASNNLLSGELPVGLTSLPRLNTLILDGNQLFGELPSMIVSLKSLNTLNLSRNKLSGHIPAAIGSLPDLLYLDLSDNEFSGEIPPELGHLRLTSLNLSSNQLSGKIPYEFENLVYENSFLNNLNLCADAKVFDLPSCYASLKESDKKPPRNLPLILTLITVILSVTVLTIFSLVRYYRRKKHRHDIATWKLTSFQRLDFTELNILSNLTENNLIGSGGSGKVYRIDTNCAGCYVAVKKIWNTRKLDQRLEKEFKAEVEVLGSIRHSNIVKLLCCISSQNSKLLVYEFMENQSLDKWLHGKKNSVHQVVLDWPRRLEIAIGVAQGLSYMHHDCAPPIIHRDVKSSNILLDREFSARIADFGLAKIVAKQGEPHSMSTVAGSFGYLAPEYAYTTKVNDKVDVYSFGVVLLELVTGREPNCRDDNISLAEWAWVHFSEGKPIIDALDTKIRETSYLEEMTALFKLGLMCTRVSPSTRPSMKEVLRTLHLCSPSKGGDKKKRESEFIFTPLLGSTTYLSSYKPKMEASEVDGDSLVLSI